MSTILENYGGETSIDGPPDNNLSDGKLLLRPLVDRVALYSPHGSDEVGFVSGNDSGTSGGQNTYRRVSPLAVRKKETESLTKKWETRVQQQKKQETKELKEKLGDKPLQRRVGSKNVEKGTCCK